jgi:membrane protein YdbS with pleckstrin-like domain
MNRLKKLQQQVAAKERGDFWLTVFLLLLLLIWFVLWFAITLNTESSAVKAVVDVVVFFLLILLLGCLSALVQIGEYRFFCFMKWLFRANFK